MRKTTHIFEMFLFTAMAAMIAFLLASGRVNLYLHPKMIRYLYFALLMLILVDFHWIGQLVQGKARNKRFRPGTLLFLIPLVFVVMNPNQISGSVLQNKTVNVGQVSTAASSGDAGNDQTAVPVVEPITEGRVIETDDLDSVIASDETQEISVSEPTTIEVEPVMESTYTDLAEEEYIAEPEMVFEEEDLSIDPEDLAELMVEDDFFQFLMDLSTNPEIYMGQTVSLDGFVFREEGYANDVFVLSRLVMSCCAADAYVAGMFVKYPEAFDLPEDGWFNVTGIIDEDAVYNPYTDGYEMNLVLIPDSVTAIEAYDNPYVYPQ